MATWSSSGFKKGLTRKQCVKKKRLNGDEALFATVNRGLKELKRGCVSLQDALYSGRPSTAVTDGNTAGIYAMIERTVRHFCERVRPPHNVIRRKTIKFSTFFSDK